MYMGMVELHSLAFLLALVLFVVAYVRGSSKIAMLLRLDYLFVLGTGFTLVYWYAFAPAALAKGALAVLLIAVMEVLLVAKREGKPVSRLWVMFAFNLIAVAYMGVVVLP